MITVLILFLLLIALVVLGLKRISDNKKYVTDFELREIRYSCEMINKLYNELSETEKRQLWGTPVHTIDLGFSKSCDNITDIPDFYFS